MAGTIIDSLTVKLGLDPSQFKEGQREAAAAMKLLREGAVKDGKEIEAQGAKVTQYFDSMKRGALGALAVFLGGREIKEFVGYVTNLDAATARMAVTFNMTERELSVWQGAMQQSGGTAESMTGSIGGLTSEMNKFVLTGQASFLPVLNQLGIGLYDQNKQLKTAGQLFLELSDAVRGMDPARASALLSMIPGMNQDTINLILQGRKAIEQYREEARKAGTTTAESGQLAKEYQQQMALLERSSVSLGRSLMTLVLPALNATAGALSRLFQSWNVKAGSKEDAEQSAGLRNKLVSKFGSPRAVMEWLAEHSPIAGDKEYTLGLADKWYGPKGADEKGAAAGAIAGKVAAASAPTAAASNAEIDAYIRQSAIKRNIDPDQAVRVWRSEGMRGYVGDQRSSFGPFQLHYGGIAGGGNSGPGLGDEFTAKTGLDAKDSSTWKAQVDFSLDKASKGGWGPWHGWKGLPYQGIGGFSPGAPAAAAAGAGAGGGGGRQSSNTTTVGTVVVNTQATDATGIARDIKPAMERLSFTTQSDTGLV